MLRLTYHNAAQDEKTRTWLEGNITPLLCKVRRDRQKLEERWYKYWRIWNVELDAQSYMGRAKTYLPAGRSALETWVVALMQGLFPFSEWFQVDAVEGVGTQRAARAWTNMQRHFLNRVMKIKLHMPLFLRQYVTLGTAVFKHIWEEDVERVRTFERVLADAPEHDPDDPTAEVLRDEDAPYDYEEEPYELRLDDGTKVRLVERDVLKKAGPTARVVDLFHFFVYPHTAPSIQEAQLVFEDTETTIEHIKKIHEHFMDPDHEEMGRVYDHIDELVECGGNLSDEYLASRYERQRKQFDDYNPNEFYKNLSKGSVNLTECYWRGEIPGAIDPMTDEEYGEQDWLLVFVNDTWCVRAHPNPFYNKERPYRDARMLRVVDEYYGRGVAEAMASMQYMLNDISNLTIDNIVNTLNPIILINEDLVTNVESLRLAPNAKWFVDPAGVQFVTPPNVAQVGMATIQMMQGFIQDASGASFIAQGQAAPRGRGRAQNSASGLSLLLQQNQGAFQFALVELEEQLMVPILEGNYALAEQFMTEKLPILVGGEQNLPLLEERVGFEDVFGMYRYSWKGSQGVKESMTMTNQLQGFVQMAIQIRKADPTAQFQIKWPEVLRAMITKGMGLPNADQWIQLPDEPKPKTPALVLDMLKSHRPVEAGVNDNHEQMLESLMVAQQIDPQFKIDPIAADYLQQLIDQHVQAIEAQRQAEQMAMIQAALQGISQNAGAPPPMGIPGQPGEGPPPGPEGAPLPTDLNADLMRGLSQMGGGM